MVETRNSTKCCGCFTIRTGALIFAYIGLFMGSLGLLLFFIDISSGEFVTDGSHILAIIIDLSALISSILLLIGIYKGITCLLPIWWYSTAFEIVIGLVQVVLDVISKEKNSLPVILLTQFIEICEYLKYFCN